MCHYSPCQQVSLLRDFTYADRGDKYLCDGLQMLLQFLPKIFSQLLLMNKISRAENVPLGPVPPLASFEEANIGK